MRIAIAGATGLIGSQLTALARKEGHEVVEIARETGFDLTDPDTDRLEAALAGADAVVEVTSTRGVLDEQATTDFFTRGGRATSAEPRPRPASRARSCCRSSGIDREPRLRLLRAKLAQERATRESAPGPLVLRATQFHEFARQMFEWNRDGDVTRIIDVPTQPVDTARDRPAAPGPGHRDGGPRRRAGRPEARAAGRPGARGTPHTSAPT